MITGKFRFLILCQLLLLWFLGIEAVTNEDMVAAFKEQPASVQIVIARFLCAVFLHISLTDETKQGFALMKYANNHPWKFRDWSQAYSIGACQTIVVITVEVVNLAILNTNQTIMDIIMNFLALVIIADFDDYFFLTVANEPLSKFIADGTFETHTGKEVQLDDVLKVQVTSSDAARFRLDDNRLHQNSAADAQVEDITALEDSPSALTRPPAPAKADSNDGEGENEKDGPSPIEGEPEFIYIDFWEDRTCGQKVARGLYVFLRMFFASVWFYFVPFVSIYLSFSIPYQFVGQDAGDGDATEVVAESGNTQMDTVAHS